MQLDEPTLEVIRRIRPQMYARVLDDRLNKAKTYIDISDNEATIPGNLLNSTRVRQFMQKSWRSARSSSLNVNGSKTDEISENK